MIQVGQVPFPYALIHAPCVFHVLLHDELENVLQDLIYQVHKSFFKENEIEKLHHYKNLMK